MKDPLNKWPYSLFKPGYNEHSPGVWVQAPQGTNLAPKAERFYPGPGTWLEPLALAVLDYMEWRLGGYPDSYNKLGLSVVSAGASGGTFTHGNAFINPAKPLEDREDDGIYNGSVTIFLTNAGTISVPIKDLEMKPILTVATPFKWKTRSVDDAGFERLLFSLFEDLPEYRNVEWLMKTNAPDAGRDISAMRGDERVFIQCRHTPDKSHNPDDLLKIHMLSRTWREPGFDVVIYATSGTFTQDAIRWAEGETSPTFELWAGSKLEIELSKRPHLISGLGLR